VKVEAVELENIRSHTKSKIEFKRGFNCLVGGVGCGKSSVLYAIDFALFGDPLGRSYEYILREGTDAGKVTLQFSHAGKNYTLSRGVRKKGKGIGQDLEQLKLYENDRLIAQVKSDAVAEQLKAITGLDRELFREIVWVRQEQLKELLNTTPRERQKRLDELFGLSDYELAWANLQGVQKEYEGEKKAYERDPDIVTMDKLSKEYDKSVQEFASTESQMDELKKKATNAEIALKEAAQQLQSLEELRKQTEELMRQETQLKTNIENVEDNSARIADEIACTNTSIENMAQKLQSLEKEAQANRENLTQAELRSDSTPDEQRKHLQALDEQLRSLAGEQEATRKEIREAEKRLSSLATENKCPLCLQNLHDDYKVDLLDKLNKTDIEGKRKLEELQNNLDELEQLRNLVSNAALGLQTLTPKIDELKTRVSDEHQELEKLSKEFEEKQLLEKQLREQLGVVRKEISMFDLSQLEKARELRDKAFAEHSQLKSKLETVETRKDDLGVRMEELKQRLDNAQEKMERMKRIESLLQIVTDVRDAYRSIQPRMRSEFVSFLQRMIQQFLDDLTGGIGPVLTVLIDESYSPIVKGEEGFEREVTNLSGGERTLLAFAYRLGLGQLIMQSRTGHGLGTLLLDEPTESLGREDGSIDRLAEAISRLKAIEQIIAVTHSEAFAEKAEHVIRVEKEAGASRIFQEK
jgi:exonuclease SbcC